MNEIELELADDVFQKIALMAHEENMTINHFVSNLLRDRLYQEQIQGLESRIRELEFQLHVGEI